MKKFIWARLSIEVDQLDRTKCAILCRFRHFGVTGGRIGATCTVFNKPVQQKRCPECLRADKKVRT